ncbi:hypothetical protein [uncultured Sphingomonas sp.]|uniref:hypothetical protein n=1 Tax=uncultured Sphingomonas sp. TaxID=158754 RepID=UPI0035CBCB9F
MLTTPSDWIALALALLGGLLLGLAFAPRGRKWQDRYVTERDAHAAFRRDSESRLAGSDARIREMETERTRYAGSDARIAELEREREAHAAELAREREAVSLSQARATEMERNQARPAADPRIAELERDRVSLGRAQGRIAELERENARLSQGAGVAAPVVASVTPGTRRVMGERSKSSWFDFGPRSDPRAHPRD